MKVCSKCKIEKDESEFNRSKRNKGGLSTWCKPCKNKHRYRERNEYLMCKKNYYLANNESEKKKRNDYRSNNRSTLNEKRRDAIEKLSNSYLKMLLISKRKFYKDAVEIHPNLINLLKELIINKREIKKQSNDNKD